MVPVEGIVGVMAWGVEGSPAQAARGAARRHYRNICRGFSPSRRIDVAGSPAGGLQLAQDLRHPFLEDLLPLRGQDAIAVFLRPADVGKLLGRRRVIDVAVG